MANKMDKNKVAVIVAHPDDELLGVGGTLCRHKDEGDEISILIFANGEDSRGSLVSNPDKRLSQAQKVAKSLKAELIVYNLPDNAFDTVSLLSVAKKVEEFIEKIKPNIIYTHHGGDLNIDHRIIHDAVITASRPIAPNQTPNIYSFETLSSTEWQTIGEMNFHPNYFVDVSKFLKEKVRLLSVYRDELRDFPHPRSIEGVEILAKYRGMQSGLKAAEAFQIERVIKK